MVVKTKAQRAHCKKVATELAKKGTSASGRALARCRWGPPKAKPKAKAKKKKHVPKPTVIVQPKKKGKKKKGAAQAKPGGVEDQIFKQAGLGRFTPRA